MGRNCNLELRLLPSSASLSSNASRAEYHTYRLKESTETREEGQEMTIFYNGQIHVCDATELQARAIILLAIREMNENRMKLQTIESQRLSSSSTTPQSSADESYCATVGALPMKRSLQRFLQKRNQRIQQQSTPYHR